MIKSNTEMLQFLRSEKAGYDKNACAVCKRKDGVLYKVLTFAMDQKLLECDCLLQKKDVEIKLNSICNRVDTVANDAF